MTIRRYVDRTTTPVLLTHLTRSLLSDVQAKAGSSVTGTL